MVWFAVCAAIAETFFLILWGLAEIFMTSSTQATPRNLAGNNWRQQFFLLSPLI